MHPIGVTQMAQGIVKQITFNVPKVSKAGKAYSVTNLKFITEGGAAKSEFIFENATFHSVVAGLGIGDKIDATYIKNGEFWNLTDVKLVEKGTGTSAPSPSSPPFVGGVVSNTTSMDKGAGSFGFDSGDKQASIQRQNALTNATHLVAAMLGQEMYKKTTKLSILMNEIITIADTFEGYTSGRTKVEALESTIPSTTGKTKSVDPETGATEQFDGEFPE